MTTLKKRWRVEFILSHCKRGHEFTEKNTYEINGRRVCRRCNAYRDSRYRKKNFVEQDMRKVKIVRGASENTGLERPGTLPLC